MSPLDEILYRGATRIGPALSIGQISSICGAIEVIASQAGVMPIEILERTLDLWEHDQVIEIYQELGETNGND